MNISNYTWESFQFPIRMTNISCEKGRHNFPADSIIEVCRDDEFNFIAKVFGKTNDTKIAEYSHPSDSSLAGEFLEGENISGHGISSKSKYELKGCHVINVTFSPCDDPLFHSYFMIEIRLDFLIESNESSQSEVASLMELFLTGKTDILFARNTYYYDSEGIKVRTGIDESITKSLFPRRMAWDFFLIELAEFSFIVQEVQSDILPAWANGFIVEYRSSFGKIPSEEIRIAISEILSFMLGVEFLNIGHSKFNSNKEIIERYGIEPYGDNVITRCRKPSMPPLRYPKLHGRTNVEDILNQIIPTYLKLRKDLKLNTVLWKYWLSQNSAIGINLPVLSSALEGLAETYLKYYDKIPQPDDETIKRYKKFLQDNSAFIESLREYSFGKSVINKIENPYNYGVGEKLSIFFNTLTFVLEKDSVENEALISRNKMSHSSSGIDSIKKAKTAIQMTRAYQTLFHRTLLKILNYNGGYTDYYTVGHPEIDLSENIKLKRES